MSSSPLSHVGADGKPRMVDVGDKKETLRTALAEVTILLPSKVSTLFQHDDDVLTAKGSVKQTAIIAGTMAVKKTAEVIPFCHSIAIEGCKITITKEGDRLKVACWVRTTGKTGVEMEALHGCQITALTVYDMLKSISHQLVINDLKLVKKTGGKSDL